MANMRFLKDEPWIYLKEKNPSLVSYDEVRQVFVSRDDGFEVWSRVILYLSL